MTGVEEARQLAHDLLADDLPSRWDHVRGVGGQAVLFRYAYRRRDVDLLMAAGYVHDIGYAEAIGDTGFHPIDGARHLRRLGFDERIVNLVANHTCAHIEADLRDLGQILRQEFPRWQQLPHDELLYCDLTIGPTGEKTTVEARLADIKSRYGPEHLVSRFIGRAEDELLAAAARAGAKIRHSYRELEPWPGTSRDVRTCDRTSPNVPSRGCPVPSVG